MFVEKEVLALLLFVVFSVVIFGIEKYRNPTEGNQKLAMKACFISCVLAPITVVIIS